VWIDLRGSEKMGCDLAILCKFNIVTNIGILKVCPMNNIEQNLGKFCK
jgi:hypothetical protein